jgi:HSP20 family protein
VSDRHRTYPFAAWPVGRNLRRLAQHPLAAMPRTDVFERNGDVVVKAELPGVRKEDIDLRVEDGDLVISAERREEREIIQPDGIKANLHDGVLEVTFPKPKQVEAKAKRIPIG